MVTVSFYGKIERKKSVLLRQIQSVNGIRGRVLVTLEDIVDTGQTIEKLVSILKAKKPKEIRISTLFLKEEVYDKDI